MGLERILSHLTGGYMAGFIDKFLGKGAALIDPQLINLIKENLGDSLDQTVANLVKNAPKILSQLQIDDVKGKEMSIMDWVELFSGNQAPRKEVIKPQGALTLINALSDLAEACSQDTGKVLNQLLPVLQRFVQEKHLQKPLENELKKSKESQTPLVKALIEQLSRR